MTPGVSCPVRKILALCQILWEKMRTGLRLLENEQKETFCPFAPDVSGKLLGFFALKKRLKRQRADKAA